MQWWRRVRMFIQDHRLSIGIILFVVVCLILTVFGMSKLESFYVNMTMATLPMQILTWIFASVISAFIYVYLMFGLFARQSQRRI